MSSSFIKVPAGKVLEDPAQDVPDYVYSRTVNPEDAPDKPTFIEIAFKSGDPVAIDGKAMSPATLLTHLNALGRANGIGRLDLVENRFVGMKSRGMYETPGGTILLAAHRGIEQITLDRGAAHLKDELMPKYAELIYNGFWFSPEREMLQALIDKSQEFVTGTVRVKLYKGSVGVVGRSSPYSLYDQDLVTFEDGQVKQFTMGNLMELLQGQLSEGMIDQLSQQIGADKEQTATAANGILSTLLGGLSQNAATPQGALPYHLPWNAIMMEAFSKT